MYRKLDSQKIVETTQALRERIQSRFPDAGLSRVCGELEVIARANTERARRLTLPNWRLRAALAAVLALGALLLALVGRAIATSETTHDLFGRLQGLEAVVNITVLIGAAVVFLITLESRAKRTRALADLHELRSIVHVIDMHQLTKDPTISIGEPLATPVSPVRRFSSFELSRYLDYCSEMLSLTAKVAALYAQSSTDPVVIDAVNDLERLTTNLRQGIWQKITLIRDVPSPLRGG